MSFAAYFTYVVTYLLMTAGLFIVIARGNLIKKLIGLGIFQSSVYLLYIGPAKLIGGTAPILASSYSLFQPSAPRTDTHRDRRWGRNSGAWLGLGCSNTRSLRQHRRRRGTGRR